LSHPKYHQKNLELCVRFLCENGYPFTVIFETINKRIKKLIAKLIKGVNEKLITEVSGGTDPETENKKHFVIPYVRGISEITASLINKSIFTVGFRILNKMNKYIKVQKDVTDLLQKNNIVYKIGCMNCEATYTGQTKRQLKTRIREHFNNIKSDNTKHSVISEHIIKYNHKFDWDSVQILDTESNYKKRLVSEMLHIKEQRHGINSQKDTEFLDESYYCLLNNLSNIK